MSGSSAGRKVAITAGAVVGVLLLGFVIKGLYTGYWNLQFSNTQHAAQNIQRSYNVQHGYQTAITNYVTAATNDIADMQGAPDAAALKVEAIDAGDQACNTALLLIPSALSVPTEMQSWINGNCSAGTLSLTSPIRTGNGN